MVKKMIRPLALVLIFSLLLPLCCLPGSAYAVAEAGVAEEENTEFMAGDSGSLAEPPGTDANAAAGDPEDAALPDAVEGPASRVSPLSSGGTISGRVTDAATGEGIEGVQVIFYNDENSKSVYTDEEGYYTLKVIAGTNYTIMVRGQDVGYTNDYIYDITVYEDEEQRYDFTLGKLVYGTITGRVTDDASGLGIPGVRVYVDNDEYHFETQTDTNGDYSLQVAVGGNYFISALGVSVGYANVCFAIGDVCENKELEQDFVLARLNATISGRVTDAADGTVIAHVYVGVSSGEHHYYTWTDVNGNYSLQVVGGSVYTFSVLGEEFGYVNAYMYDVQVCVDEELEQDFALARLNATIRGRVTDSDSDEGIEGVQVSVFNNEHHFYTWTDVNGNYSLQVVGGSIYTLLVWGKNFGYANAYMYDVQVCVDDVLDQDFPLDKLSYVTFSGRVIDASTEEGIKDVPIEVYSWGGLPASDGAAGMGAGPIEAYDSNIEWASTCTDEQGNYEIKVIAGTSYDILAWGEECGYTNTSYYDIYVDEGDEQIYNFELYRLDAAIRGRVTDAITGEGIDGVEVNVYNDEYSFYTQTNFEGYYTLQVVGETYYTVNTYGQFVGYSNDFEDGIWVVKDSELVLNFELNELRFGTVAGRVTDAVTGEGIAGVDVYVYDSEYGYYFASWTDTEGYYTLQVAEGTGYNVDVVGWLVGYYIDYACDVEVAAGETLQLNFKIKPLETAAEAAVAAVEAETANPFPGEGTVQQVMTAESNWREADRLVFHLAPGALKDDLQGRLAAVRQVIDARVAQLADEAESAVVTAEELTDEPFPSEGTAEEVAGVYRLVEEYIDFIFSYVENLIERLLALLQRITDRYMDLLLESAQPLETVWNDSSGMYEGQLSFADDTVTIVASSPEPIEGVSLALLKAGMTMAPAAPANLTPAGIYLDIEVLEGSLGDAEVRIEVEYDPEMVDPDKLRLYRFNEYSYCWELLPVQGVDRENCIIWALTTGGFSTFGVFEFKYVPGDLDGDGKINVGDAIMVLRHIVGLSVLQDAALMAADVDGDGKVNVGDAIMILRHIVGLIEEFPVNR